MSDLVLVTGGAGFLGRHVVRTLLPAGRKVRVLDVAPDPGGDDVEWHTGSVTDSAAVSRAMAGVTGVIHLAAIPHLWAKPVTLFDEVNAHGTQVVLEAARAADVGAVVHVSSLTTRIGGATGGKPQHVTEAHRLAPQAMLGAYPRSKWLAEDAARKAWATGMPVRIAIPTMPMGPGDAGMTPPTRMVLDLVSGKTPAYLDTWMNIADVRDMAVALVALLDIETGSDGVLVGGDNILLGDLLARLQHLSGVTMPTATVPGWLAEGFAYLDEFVADHVTGKPPKAPVTGVRLARRAITFDMTLAEEILPPRRHTLNQTLNDLLGWFTDEALWQRS